MCEWLVGRCEELLVVNILVSLRGRPTKGREGGS